MYAPAESVDISARELIAFNIVNLIYNKPFNITIDWFAISHMYRHTYTSRYEGQRSQNALYQNSWFRSKPDLFIIVSIHRRFYYNFP